jgi:hypothetical protein
MWENKKYALFVKPVSENHLRGIALGGRIIVKFISILVDPCGQK